MNTPIPVTDWLYLNGCDLPHVRVITTHDALEAHEEGKNVVVPTIEIAHSVLLRSGLSKDMVRQRITWSAVRLFSDKTPAHN